MPFSVPGQQRPGAGGGPERAGRMTTLGRRVGAALETDAASRTGRGAGLVAGRLGSEAQDDVSFGPFLSRAQSSDLCDEMAVHEASVTPS